MSQTTTVAVTGMTCQHCVASVTEELSEVPGVQQVQVELVEGGESPVTIVSDHPLPEASVRDAVTEAGYALA